MVNRKIKDMFSDSLIIIDEAHNITTKEDTFKKGQSKKKILVKVIMIIYLAGVL